MNPERPWKRMSVAIGLAALLIGGSAGLDHSILGSQSVRDQAEIARLRHQLMAARELIARHGEELAAMDEANGTK